MAVIYALHDHDRQPIGQQAAPIRLAVGQELIHEQHRYLVVAGPPPHGARFVDPLFSGYAVEAAEGLDSPEGTRLPSDGSPRASDFHIS